MKATVFAIKKFAVHDGDGIRTTVFLKGCPLRCIWCHNPEGLSGKPELAYRADKCISCGFCTESCKSGAQRIAYGLHVFERALCVGCGECEDVCPQSALTLYGREMTVDELLPELLADRDFYESSGGGVTVSGGECLLYPDFCRELGKRLRDLGISLDVDTSGAVPYESIAAVLPYTDCYLYDVKAIDSEVHRACTGQPNERILENLSRLLADGARVEIRVPYVPDCNGGEMEKIARHLAALPPLSAISSAPRA